MGSELVWAAPRCLVEAVARSPRPDADDQHVSDTMEYNMQGAVLRVGDQTTMTKRLFGFVRDPGRPL